MPQTKERAAARRARCLDEAQLLDELIHPDADGGGARFGLRVLRQLQVAAYKKTEQQCLLLPIATGIRPTVSLRSETEGQNVPVGLARDDASHVSFGDFRTIVHNHVKEMPCSEPVGKVVSLLSAAYYPRVRKVLQWKDHVVVMPIDAKFDITYEVALKILIADFTRTSGVVGDATMELKSIPHEIPVARVASEKAQPLVHFYVFKPLWDCIQREHLLPLPPLGSFRIRDVKNSYLAFEEFMFPVFGLFMGIFCHPSVPGTFRKLVHPVINEWLPTDSFLLEDSTDFITVSKAHYLPFEGHASHEVAFAGSIFSEILSSIESLKNGCALWMRFGSEAPLDYMLLVRREGNHMEVRFGDAKHHMPDKKSLPCERRDVCQKAGLVHEGLQKQLLKMDMRLDAFDKNKHVLLFTNVPNETAVSPSTFCWSPWTPFLFQNGGAVTANSQSGPQERPGQESSGAKE